MKPLPTELISVFVPGLPRPQGSVKPMVNKGTGRAFVKYKDTTIDHRNQVIHALSSSWHGTGDGVSGPIEGGVVLVVNFWFARPKSHYRTGKNSALLREGAPMRMISAPDTDKLLRLVGDALEASGVLGNDSQIDQVIASKAYAPEGKQGTFIAVYRDIPLA